MSHFTTIKTKITDRECLKKTVKDLGYTYSEIKSNIKFLDRKNLTIKLGPSEINCIWNGRTFEFSGKTSILAGSNFLSEIMQKYAYNKITQVLSRKGFVISEEKNEENEIILTVRQW